MATSSRVEDVGAVVGVGICEIGRDFQMSNNRLVNGPRTATNRTRVCLIAGLALHAPSDRHRMPVSRNT